MMISPERLERYKDFVDPDHSRTPYDQKQGLSRLLGVLTPDPKGIVLAGMGNDWHGSIKQLHSAVMTWLEDRGLPQSVWPVTRRAPWQYCETIDSNGEVRDGSLVKLGAVVKRAEDSLQLLYQRSIAGAELAVPLIGQVVLFVSKAREYAETRRFTGYDPHKFDSMGRILGSVHSATDERRPLAVFDAIRFLIDNPGQHRQMDLFNAGYLPRSRWGTILPSLADCGIIDYISPKTEVEGWRGKGWAIYTAVNPQSIAYLDPYEIYQDIKGINKSFHRPGNLVRLLDYMKEYPDSEYEHSSLAEKLSIDRTYIIGGILSSLADLGILIRIDPRFKGRKWQSSASANYLTHLFYDLVCLPAEQISSTLTPIPQRPWDKKQLAAYLENYGEERSRKGLHGGEAVRSLLIAILSDKKAGNEEGMKLSHIRELFNRQSDRVLQAKSLGKQLRYLINSGSVEQPKLGYYRLANTS